MLLRAFMGLIFRGNFLTDDFRSLWGEYTEGTPIR
jgi:hypothetical protein